MVAENPCNTWQQISYACSNWEVFLSEFLPVNDHHLSNATNQVKECILRLLSCFSSQATLYRFSIWAWRLAASMGASARCSRLQQAVPRMDHVYQDGPPDPWSSKEIEPEGKVHCSSPPRGSILYHSRSQTARCALSVSILPAFERQSCQMQSWWVGEYLSGREIYQAASRFFLLGGVGRCLHMGVYYEF